MRSLLLAFLLPLFCGTADAATYHFSFKSETLVESGYCEESGTPCSTGGQLRIHVALSMPDVISRSGVVDARYGAWAGTPNAPNYSSPYPVLAMEDNFIACCASDWRGQFSFSTDETGKLTSANYSVDDLGFVGVFASLNFGSFDDFGGNQSWSAAGKWTLSTGPLPPVPLPAGLGLMCTALAGLALLRARRKS